MSTIAATPQAEPPAKLIAPLWHTLLIVAFLVVLSVAGNRWLSPLLKGIPHGRELSYSVTLAIEWFTVFLVWLGVRLRSVRVSELIGGSWPSAMTILRDVGIALLFLLVSNIVLGIISHLLKNTPSEAVRQMVPRGSSQIVFWILLSLSAGICEEITFRGYFQKQFTALTGNVAIAILLQAAIFGGAHGYQGWKSMIVIAVYGCLFGLLTNWVRNLRPGIMAHFLQDSVSGVLAGRFLK